MTFSPEEREGYRRHKERVGYDKRARAVGVILDAFNKAHPNAGPYARPRDGIVTCGNPIVHDDVKLRLDANGHEYHDHKHCHSWACPVCAPKRARERASEIEQALIGANKRGFQGYFITFTVPHRRCHSTAHVLKVLDECYQKTRHDKGIRKVLSDNGFVGMVKCKDYTLTDNGTHAHLHCIWLFNGVEDAAGFADVLRARLRDKWDRLVYLETGRHIHSKYGFDLEYIDLGEPGSPDAERVAHYAAKSISVYVAENEKGKSKTPFDLLSSAATEEDKARYLDWYKGQKGKRHILFSPGLKKLLGVGESKPAPADNAVVAWVGYDNAYLLKDVNVKHEFEERAAASVSAALSWLEDKAECRREELRYRFPGAGAADDIWTVPYMELVRELDDCPRDEWGPVLSRFREVQDVEFPREMDYWKCFRSVSGAKLIREFEEELGAPYCRTDEGKELVMKRVEEKMEERKAVRDRLERRIEELSGGSRRRRVPLYTPASYRKCETFEERAEWLERHRGEYRARVEERLRLSFEERAAAVKLREDMRAVERGEWSEDSLLPAPDGEPERPRRQSGLGAALSAAGIEGGCSVSVPVLEFVPPAPGSRLAELGVEEVFWF